MIVDINVWNRIQAWRGFQYYDPYLTYSDPGGDCFIDPTGKPAEEHNFATNALFRIAKEAFKHLTNKGPCTKEEFNEGYDAYLFVLDEMRESISKLHIEGKLFFKNYKGEHLPINIEKLHDSQVFSIYWERYSLTIKTRAVDDDRAMYQELFLFHVLREVDNALIGLKQDCREAMVAGIEAANALCNAVAIESVDEHMANARTRLGYYAVTEKHKHDPKQRNKAFVRDCWEAWQKHPSNYKGKAAFARDMLDKCEHLESTKTIEDWCRRWEAETKE
jgi:hypothetical protein